MQNLENGCLVVGGGAGGRSSHTAMHSALNGMGKALFSGWVVKRDRLILYLLCNSMPFKIF